ncbi:MAG: LCP family protein [Fibrella sp.]|nr:LCP family protein [Armatimonadota bacterium]
MSTTNEQQPWQQQPIMPGSEFAQPKRRGSTRRTILIALSGVVALVCGKLLHTTTVIGGDAGPLSPITTFNNPRGEFPGKANRLNILLLGVDYSYLWRKNNVALNGARYTKESRSDTIMMLSLDMDTQKVSALSIPRDTWVTDPTGHRGKINGAYKRGGASLAARTVAELLRVTPDYYVAVKPDAVRSVVDELGGVNVETIDAMKYDDAAAGLHIDLPAGPQTINGEQAVGFARFREADTVERDASGRGIPTGRKDSNGNPIFRRKPASAVRHSKEEGDVRRMARQQQLIQAVAEKGKQPVNWLKADHVVDAALDHVETDLSRRQLFALLLLFKGLQTEQMQTATLEGHGFTPRGATYRFVPDERKKQAMVEWLLKGDEAAANRLTVVTVRNGTTVPGLARRVATLLCNQGFDARPMDTAGLGKDDEVSATRIVYGKAAIAPRARRIQQVLGGGKAVKEARPDTTGASGNTADVTVILGRDLASVGGEGEQTIPNGSKRLAHSPNADSSTIKRSP